MKIDVLITAVDWEMYYNISKNR